MLQNGHAAKKSAGEKITKTEMGLIIFVIYAVGRLLMLVLMPSL